MPTIEEERIRKVEDTLLLLPPQLEAIRDTQTEIVDHLEQINGSFGEFDERIHKVETKWDYQEKRKEEKNTDKKHYYAVGGLVVAAIAALNGIIAYVS